MNINVLHIVIAKTWGGGEQYVYDVCKEMKKQGCECFVFVDESNKYFVDRYSEVATVETGNVYVLGGLLAIKKIKSIIEREKIGLINCHSGHALLTCLLLKKLSSIRVVMFKHNALPLKKDIYHTWQLDNTDAYICVSKLVYDLQTKELPERFLSKFHLVYNGIDVDKFNKNKIDSNKGIREYTIGYAGRITRNKGIDILIKALGIFVKYHPSTILKIAGSDEHHYKEELQKLIDDLNLSNNVIFCGQVQDMEGFYKSLDVFVLPSMVRESFGLVICEAICCGVPVITTNSGAQIEILTNENYGRVINKGDVAALERSIEDYYYKRASIKKDGFNYIQDKFSSKSCVRELKRIYSALIE